MDKGMDRTGGDRGRAPAVKELYFSVLGPLSCETHGQRLTLGGAKQQMVLALLLLESNRVVPVERLLEWVWPDSGEDGGAGSPSTLQVYVSNLRRLLAPIAEGLDRSIIITQRPGYMIDLADDELDLLEFEQLRRQGEDHAAAGDFSAATDNLRTALDLWQGDCLSGLPLDVADSGIANRIDQARITTREVLAEAELQQGRHRQVLAELQTWVSASPLNERLRGHLMVALYRSGRQAEALACYQQGRDLLVEELGIDPSRELRALESQILNQDPALDGPDPLVDLFDDAASTQLRGSLTTDFAELQIGDRTLALDRTVVTIGRLHDRTIVVEDPGVSRHHAEIRRTGNSYRIVDMGSSNGTIVNESRVTDRLLSDGDVIRLGGVEMTFNFGRP